MKQPSAASDYDVLILPGWQNSGPGHWQSRWEARHASFTRVPMTDWNQADRDAWCRTLDATVAAKAAAGRAVRFAAHSLGCLTVAFWAARYATPEVLRHVQGALLVAVPDPAAPAFPHEGSSGFASAPLELLPFPSIVVSSSDDPFGGERYSLACADAWGSRWIGIGPRGHINADSGLGDWAEGLGWLGELQEPQAP
ncbi:RBBP9/YdeN family alpha/beta hydrolase [Paraburkholderia phosphatilytica]|uniref:RBBP9/YdeN family alpha/beta hydrolase n=1 Tax=Paraburkholderia phosphatilytica TaxID=2282883 RepID=UPI000E4DA18A|nr:alpha/beta hydrolase [Paraburkholderia phosphatilytica]